MEDREHLMKCNIRHDWKVELMKTLFAYEREWLDPTLHTILYKTLEAWMEDSELDFDADYEACYKRLIDQQEKVGWNQLWFGRFVEDWRFIQDEYLQLHPHMKDKKRSGQIWVTGATEISWEHVHSCWLTRNG